MSTILNDTNENQKNNGPGLLKDTVLVQLNKCLRPRMARLEMVYNLTTLCQRFQVLWLYLKNR